MNTGFALLKNILNPPILCFALGFLLSRTALKIPSKLIQWVTTYLLIALGMKAGETIATHASSSEKFFITSFCLISWGFLQPFVSYFLLKKTTTLSRENAAAIAASFGSISLMTFMTAIYYLDQRQIPYESFIIPIAALMEAPGIISGLLIAKKSESFHWKQYASLLSHAFLNRAVLCLLMGGAISYLGYTTFLAPYTTLFQKPFQLAICLFLLDMGMKVFSYLKNDSFLNQRLIYFGLYMPLIGAMAGLFISYFLKLDIGSTTLTLALCSSASYIAVPAAMRIALPEAKEAIYLPLALAVAFPFNVVVGIPLYFYVAQLILRL
jgi:hypothetical protein